MPSRLYIFDKMDGLEFKTINVCNLEPIDSMDFRIGIIYYVGSWSSAGGNLKGE